MKEIDNKIVEIEKCEYCPFGYLDMEDGWYCTDDGTPQDRKSGELVPHDCPLLQKSITVKLKES